MSTRCTFVRDVDGFEYTMSDDDVLWLARSLQGECGGKCGRDHASLVAWTEMNRFLLYKPQADLGTWPTFTALIRAFSQPTNPGWLADGKFCKGKTTGNCAPSVTARRAVLQKTAFEDLGYDARMYATAFSEGGLPELFPGGGEHFVDFASYAGADKQGTYVAEGCVGKSCNYFYTRAQSKAAGLLGIWLSGGVHTVGGSTAPEDNTGMDIGFKVVIGGLVLALAWAVGKLISGKRKKP